MLALAMLGRTRNAVLAPVVRLALYDVDPDVRAKAADVLGELGSPSSIGVLFDAAVGDPSVRDAGAREMVGVAAQGAIYRIAEVSPPVGEEAFEARVAAFRAWWKDPATRAKKLAAIEDTLKVPDRAPWYLLRPFFEDEDPYVWTRTYYAFKKVASHAAGDSPIEVWLRSLPVHDEKTLVPDRREAFVQDMRAWWAKKPA
jgi:HEAT repeat protein